LRLLAAAAAAVSAAPASHAGVLMPAAEISPVGTTVSARPEFAGLVLADAIRPFDVAVASGGRLKGHLQDRVVRSNETGTLIFDQRIVIDTIPAASSSVSEWQRSGMTPVTTDADYRLDGLGSVGAGSMQRQASGNQVRFKLTRLVAAGESTYFHTVLTNATGFAETGTVVLSGPGVPAITLPSYAPSGVPQPYYTATAVAPAPGNWTFINDHGQLSTSVGGESGIKAMLWQPARANSIDGSLHPVPMLPGYLHSVAGRINNLGQLVGTNYMRATARPSDTRQRAFLWKPLAERTPVTGSLVDLGLYPGGSYSSAEAINDLGQVTGAGDYAHAPPTAAGVPSPTSLLWTGGSVVKAAGTDYGNGFSINNHGVIVGYGNQGYGTYQGFMWTPSSVGSTTGTRLAVFDVGGVEYTGSGVTRDINDAGVAVGGANIRRSDTLLEPHGYIWSPGRVQDLGPNELPVAINEAGISVGWYAGSTATLYRDGVRTKLQYFVSPAEHWKIGWAYDLNRSEQITGAGNTPTSAGSILLMTPVRIQYAGPSPRGAGAAYTMRIEGTGFREGAKLLYNGAPLATRRLHSNLLEADVPDTLGSEPEITVMVQNPDGTLSNVRRF
jgi:hypothetical protein